MGPIGQALSMDATPVAEAILRLGVAKMAAAVHEVSVARGFDPREFALLSYGGAGPLHAALVAAEIGIDRVIVPPSPGAFSAFGTLCSALSKDRSRTALAALDAASLASAATAFEVMADDIRTEFAAEGAAVAEMTADRQFDLRYRGQAHELTVAVARGCGRRDSSRGVELVNLRLVGRIPIETPAWTVAAGGSGRPSGQRRVTEAGAPFACDVWQRGDLQPGTTIPGPAVIEEMSATTYLPGGWTLSVGALGELQLRRGG